MTSPEPERLRIRIDEDGLAAHVAIGAGPALARAALDAALAAPGVVAGLDASALELAAGALAVESPALDDYCVAHGRAAQDPTSDVLVLAEPIGPTAGSLRPDESLDYRERRLIVPVTAGDELGRIVPGEPGEAGFDVRGKELLPMPAAAPRRRPWRRRRARRNRRLLRATRTREHAPSTRTAPSTSSPSTSIAAAVDLAQRQSRHRRQPPDRPRRERRHERARRMSTSRSRAPSRRREIEAGGSIEIGGGVIGGEEGPGPRAR
jgi:hypothetical protein